MKKLLAIILAVMMIASAMIPAAALSASAESEEKTLDIFGEVLVGSEENDGTSVNTATVVGAIAKSAVEDYDSLTMSLEFTGGALSEPKSFTQEFTSVYSTVRSVATTDSATATAQGIEYFEGEVYLFALTIVGIDSGKYDVAITLTPNLGGSALIEESVTEVISFSEFVQEGDVIAAFDKEVGSLNVFNNAATVTHDTTVKYGDEKGSLKVTVDIVGEIYIAILAPGVADVSSYDYIVFRVFNPNDVDVQAGTLWACDTTVPAGEWAEVVVPVSLFAEGKITDFGAALPSTDITGFSVRLMGLGGLSVGDSLYVSAVYAVKEEVEPADTKAVIAAFDKEVGSLNPFNGCATVSHDTTVKYGDEEGSLKVVINTTGEVYIALTDPAVKDVSEYDHIVFRVYNPNAAGIQAGTLWACDTTVPAGEWAEVVVPVSLFAEGRITDFAAALPATDITGFSVRLMGLGGLTVGDALYVSAIYAEKASEEPASPISVVAALDKEAANLNPFGGCAALSNDSTVKYGDEEGSLKVSINTTGEVYIALTAPAVTDVSEYDHIVFRVYNPNAADIMAGVLWSCDTIVPAGEWAEVVVPVSLFAEGRVDALSGAHLAATDITGFALRLMSLSGLSVGDLLYISAVYAVKV